MKKRNAVKLAALALSAGAVSAPAVVHAQSSVTLYGILDAGITYVNNTGGSHVVEFDDVRATRVVDVGNTGVEDTVQRHAALRANHSRCGHDACAQR